LIRVYFSPIVWDREINYAIENERITITAEGITEEYDFTGLPNGSLESQDIEIPFTFLPIITAEKVEGILYIEVLNPISQKASEFEKFPEWIEVGEE